MLYVRILFDVHQSVHLHATELGDTAQIVSAEVDEAQIDLVERYAKEWAGPAAIVRKVKVRLGAPNHPGDTMTMRGSVASVDGTRVELAVTGTNSLGPHVSGSVVLELPVSTGDAA